MTKNNKEINVLDSMVDLSYQILYQNKEPMSINELIKKVFEMKNIESDDKDKFIQLYLDIVSSGRFVFVGHDLWNIKTNNLHLWDQDYFTVLKGEESETQDVIYEGKEILDFKEFDLDKNKNDEDISEDENEDDVKLEDKELDLNIDSEVLDIPEENIEEELFDNIDKNTNTEENEFVNDEYEEYF
ncbi:DNA-directed RNA polymerase subunit delta ['Camptotheca acuminata' phytoplasma]|uniref:DNA-directed RNA polymerase subunit delta n=1 Tax='Camptotheca acuminata' phytoplasma TaxID=3239192 RepID=UPI00351A7614